MDPPRLLHTANELLYNEDKSNRPVDRLHCPGARIVYLLDEITYAVGFPIIYDPRGNLFWLTWDK